MHGVPRNTLEQQLSIGGQRAFDRSEEDDPIKKLILNGLTPAPEVLANDANKRIARLSNGSASSVPVSVDAPVSNNDAGDPGLQAPQRDEGRRRLMRALQLTSGLIGGFAALAAGEVTPLAATLGGVSRGIGEEQDDRDDLFEERQDTYLEALQDLEAAERVEQNKIDGEKRRSDLRIEENAERERINSLQAEDARAATAAAAALRHRQGQEGDKVDLARERRAAAYEAAIRGNQPEEAVRLMRDQNLGLSPGAIAAAVRADIREANLGVSAAELGLRSTQSLIDSRLDDEEDNLPAGVSQRYLDEIAEMSKVELTEEEVRLENALLLTTPPAPRDRLSNQILAVVDAQRRVSSTSGAVVAQAAREASQGMIEQLNALPQDERRELFDQYVDFMNTKIEEAYAISTLRGEEVEDTAAATLDLVRQAFN